MAKLIPADVNVPMSDVVPAKGKTFTLKELQAVVGGYVEAIEIVTNGNKRTIWLNEEGLNEGLPYNPRATMMANLNAVSGYQAYHLVGDCIVCDAKENS